MTETPVIHSPRHTSGDRSLDQRDGAGAGPPRALLVELFMVPSSGAACLRDLQGGAHRRGTADRQVAGDMVTSLVEPRRAMIC